MCLEKKNKHENLSLQYEKNLKARNESVYSELNDIDGASDESVIMLKIHQPNLSLEV